MCGTAGQRHVLSRSPPPSLSLIGCYVYARGTPPPAQAEDASLVGGALSLRELQAAYSGLMAEEVLDTTAGSWQWERACLVYEQRVDRVEGTIARRLHERLGAAKSADAMFRVFSKFNALFFRPRIRGAIQQFQEQLITQVSRELLLLLLLSWPL